MTARWPATEPIALHLTGAAICGAIVCSAILCGAQDFPQPPLPPVASLDVGTAPAPTRYHLANGMRVELLEFGLAPQALVRVVIATSATARDECRVRSLLESELNLGGSPATTSARSPGRPMSDQVSMATRPQRVLMSLEVMATQAPGAAGLLAGTLRRAVFDSIAWAATASDTSDDHPPEARDIDSAAVQRFEAAIFSTGSFGPWCSTPARPRTPPAKPQPAGRPHLAADQTTIYVVGRFDQNAVRRAIASAAQRWTSTDPAHYEQSTGVAPLPPTLALLQRVGAKQVGLVVGAPLTIHNDTDLASWRLANLLLGGTTHSRITTDVRESKGFSYAPHSQLVTTPSGADYWAEITDVSPQTTWPAVREISHEIAQLASAPPTNEELDGAKRYFIGRTLLARSSRTGMADAMEAADMDSGERSDLDGTLHQALQVQPTDVQHAVASNLAARKLTIAIATDSQAMSDQIAELRRGIAELRTANTP